MKLTDEVAIKELEGFLDGHVLSVSVEVLERVLEIARRQETVVRPQVSRYYRSDLDQFRVRFEGAEMES